MTVMADLYVPTPHLLPTPHSLHLRLFGANVTSALWPFPCFDAIQCVVDLMIHVEHMGQTHVFQCWIGEQFEVP